MGRLLDLQETAKLYGITPNGARTWISRNKVKSVQKIDNTYYIDEDESKSLVKKMFMTKYERKIGSDHILSYMGDVQILLRGKLHEEYFKELSKQELNWILKYALSKTPPGDKLFYIIIGPVDDEPFERFISQKQTFLIGVYSVKNLIRKIQMKKEQLLKETQES